MGSLSERYRVVLTPEERQWVASCAIELPSFSLKGRLARLFLYLDENTTNAMSKKKAAKLLNFQRIRLYQILKTYQEKGLEAVLTQRNTFG